MVEPEYTGNPEGESDDDICDLDPDKKCDNCMKCLFNADFNAVTITGFALDEDEPS